MIKIIVKLMNIVTIIEATSHSRTNLKYSIPEDIHVVFHSGSNYDYHFIIKEITKEFEGGI